MEGSMTPTATGLLREDHRKVEELYHRFNQTQDYEDRADLGEDLCKELEIHSRLEECLVYPGLARERAEGPLVRHFGQEHGEVKRLISEVRLADGEEGHQGSADEALISKIMSTVEHHVREEEGQAFPVLEADGERNEALGAELAKLKMKLKMCPPVFHTIDLDVPVRMAYNQWTQFEQFPRFLDDVKEVRQLDDTHVQWRVEIAGKEFQWTAEIYEQIPDQRIAWSSVDGAVNAGSASFRSLSPNSTRMLVEMAYEPTGLVEDLGALLGVVSRNVAAELQKFKEHVEHQSRESGAWRGKVEGNPVDPELSKTPAQPKLPETGGGPTGGTRF